MSHEKSGLKKVSEIGFVAAFGIFTVSSSLGSPTISTMNATPAYYYEANNYYLTSESLCNSSLLSRQSIGDIFSTEKRSDLVQKHNKIGVNLQITRIVKHISSFDFEEEFEEI